MLGCVLISKMVIKTREIVVREKKRPNIEVFTHYVTRYDKI